MTRRPADKRCLRCLSPDERCELPVGHGGLHTTEIPFNGVASWGDAWGYELDITGWREHFGVLAEVCP